MLWFSFHHHHPCVLLVVHSVCRYCAIEMLHIISITINRTSLLSSSKEKKYEFLLF